MVVCTLCIATCVCKPSCGKWRGGPFVKRSSPFVSGFLSDWVRSGSTIIFLSLSLSHSLLCTEMGGGVGAKFFSMS